MTTKLRAASFQDGAVTTAKIAASAITNAKIADGAVDSDAIGSSAIVANKLGIGQIGGRRNMVINGAMQVAQRGTSFTGFTNGSNGYFLDRFGFYESGTSSAVFTISQASDGPDGFANSMKVDCTTSASLASNERLFIQQRIEGQNLQQLKKGTSSAEKVTVSFHVKSNLTGTAVVMVHDTDNQRHIAKSYTIDSANTWEKKTITFDGDTTGAFDDDNDTSIRLEFYLQAGSTYASGTLPTSWQSFVTADTAPSQTIHLASSTDNNFYLTGVQLEVGSQATPFEHRSFGEELALCQRYLYRISGSLYEFFVNGVRNNTNYLWCPLQLPVPLRTQPTITTSGTSNNCFGIWHGAGGSWSTTHTTMGVYANPDLHDGSVIQLALALNGVSTGFASGQSVNLGFQNNGFLNCDAEL